MTGVLTAALMRRMWPRAPKATVDAIVRVSLDVLADAQIDTPIRLAHFMAQISHECSGGTIVRENMNYTAERILAVFGVGKHSAKVTAAEAARLARNPEALAERVYGLGNPKKAAELGNVRNGDGYRFRGNGMLQLTGRANHRDIARKIGIDIEANPEMLEDPAKSFRVAALEFKALSCLQAADADNINLVTRRVNGGDNGIADRKSWLAKWKAALADAPNVQRPKVGYSAIVEDVQQRLVSLGYYEVGGIDGLMGGKTRGAITAFMLDRGRAQTTYVTDELRVELQAAIAEGWKRPVAPARAFADINVVAPKAPAARHAGRSRFWSKLLALPATAGAAVSGVMDHFPDAKEKVDLVSSFFASVPGWAWFLVAAAIGFMIWRSANKAQAAVVEDYRTGRLN